MSAPDGKHPQADPGFFQRREFCFTLFGDIFVRYQSFKVRVALQTTLRSLVWHSVSCSREFWHAASCHNQKLSVAWRRTEMSWQLHSETDALPKLILGRSTTLTQREEQPTWVCQLHSSDLNQVRGSQGGDRLAVVSSSLCLLVQGWAQAMRLHRWSASWSLISISRITMTCAPAGRAPMCARPAGPSWPWPCRQGFVVALQHADLAPLHKKQCCQGSLCCTDALKQGFDIPPC